MRLHALLLAGIALPAAPALAQETAAAVAEADTIIVTGTRRVDRTVADSPVPVDVVSLTAIQNSGTTETGRALRDLVPSFSFPQPTITDGTDVIRPASLRGLGPDQTLVLLNGKRRHLSALLNLNGSLGRGSQAVDVNFIPSSALSRVEVLRDGAAAQYGSDAIAGVINFQMNDAREGGRISATYGANVTDISGVNRMGDVVLGSNGLPVLTPDGVLTLEDSGRKLHQTDGETLTLTGNIGLPIAADGFLNLTGEYRKREATKRTGYDRRQQYNVVANNWDVPKEQAFDRRSHQIGDPKTEDWMIAFNAGVPLDDRVEAYAFGTEIELVEKDSRIRVAREVTVAAPVVTQMAAPAMQTVPAPVSAPPPALTPTTEMPAAWICAVTSPSVSIATARRCSRWLTHVVPGLRRISRREAVCSSQAVTARHMSGPANFETDRTRAHRWWSGPMIEWKGC